MNLFKQLDIVSFIYLLLLSWCLMSAFNTNLIIGILSDAETRYVPPWSQPEFHNAFLLEKNNIIFYYCPPEPMKWGEQHSVHAICSCVHHILCLTLKKAYFFIYMTTSWFCEWDLFQTQKIIFHQSLIVQMYLVILMEFKTFSFWKLSFFQICSWREFIFTKS